MKGSGIVFDNARRTASESFAPVSVGDSFVAAFVGTEAGKVEHDVFGKIDAAEFREDAMPLQQVNDVCAAAHLDEEELKRWPSNGDLPLALAECCIAVPTEEAATEAPGTMGPARMSSAEDETSEAVVPPWASAVDPCPDDDTSAPILWSTLAAKLDEASDLGQRIKVRELEARVNEAGAVRDDLHREVLLNTCGVLKSSFARLSAKVKDARFEELCRRVLDNADAPHHQR